jgi:hypothetical protein
MDFLLLALLSTSGLFLCMLVLSEVGRRIGIRRKARDPEGASAGVGAIDGAVFGLMGLLVAFTFAGASARLDVRRQLIVEETNAIGTAYLRLDLLRAEVRSRLQEHFRQYVAARLGLYRKMPDIEAAREELARVAQLQGEIWSRAVAACREAETSQAAMLLLPAVNAMIDITTTRTMAVQMHPPIIVFVLLFGSALASALLAGYGMAGAKSRHWVHTVSFAAMTAVAVYVILDLEFPRLGLIRVDAFDQALVELLQSMK